MVGDALARGAKSQVFPSLSHISQEKWDLAFGPRQKPTWEGTSVPRPKKPKKNASKNT